MWFKPCWSSVLKSVLDLCATGWCREGLGRVEASGLGLRELGKKNSFSFQLTCFPSLPFPCPPAFPLCFGFAPKLNPTLLSIKLKWETTEFHLIFTQCCKSPWAAGCRFVEGRKTFWFKFLMQTQKKDFSPDCTVLHLHEGRNFFFFFFAHLVSNPRCPKLSFSLFYYWKTHWSLNVSWHYLIQESGGKTSCAVLLPTVLLCCVV